MGCSSRGAGRAGGTTSSGATITGYQYTSPTGQVKVFLNINEAKAEMRKNVGGEIRQLTS
jgi:hypothetical protein